MLCTSCAQSLSPAGTPSSSGGLLTVNRICCSYRAARTLSVRLPVPVQGQLVRRRDEVEAAAGCQLMLQVRLHTHDACVRTW